MDFLIHLAAAASILTGNLLHYEPPDPLPEVAVKHIQEVEKAKERAKIVLAINQRDRTAQRPAKIRSSGVSGCTLEYIGQKESGNNYSAQNKRSTASGKYQYLDSTWNNYSGYARAKDAPPSVQDERASKDLAAGKARQWEVCK